MYNVLLYGMEKYVKMVKKDYLNVYVYIFDEK